ncbi:DNA topoisomerase, partial [Apilactobacillus sp. F1]|nr:DNA topoisomerase [Apilactobacillus sp. F1]
VKQGWKKVFETDKDTKEAQEKDIALPKVSIGETVTADIQLKEKETKPPKPFTEGTLLTAMKTANKTVDNEEAIKILKEVEGIGTEATRASIIETLKQKKYIVSQKNRLTVTEKGKLLCKSVEAQPLLS